ncbi:ribonuclease MRP protein subunit POP4 isoform X3 [Quercus suber]|uniref:ribonuclease MRP protein subunit POP4 isoform X3 n=1 Tax=Quercus suber TaxID=58331 RepID=UPI0032DF3648
MATETAIQDPRKHALEALKRRFAFVEADLLQQKNKKSKNEDGKEPHRTTSLADKTDAAVTPSFDAQHKKDPEENAPAYLQLSQAVHENLLATNIKLLGSRLPGIVQLSSRKGDMVDKILHELLQNGDTAQKYMQKSRKINIDHFVLLDNYVQGRGICTGSHIRALRMHSKRSKKHMSMKQHKKCGSFDLPQELHKKNQLAQCLLNADLHGAFILVAECKATSFTGVSGIMIRETAETFGIITQDDVFRVVPKRFLSLFSKLIARKLHCMGTNSLQEIWACD